MARFLTVLLSLVPFSLPSLLAFRTEPIFGNDNAIAAYLVLNSHEAQSGRTSNGLSSTKKTIDNGAFLPLFVTRPSIFDERRSPSGCLLVLMSGFCETDVC
jgi:hypothetical protein